MTMNNHRQHAHPPVDGGDAHIMILVTQLERAGAQKIAIAQARHFHQCGYRVTLCFFYDKQKLLTELERSEPYRLLDLRAKLPGDRRLVAFLRLLRSLWTLYRYLRKEEVRAIETLTHYSNVLGIPIAWLARVPVRIASQRNVLAGFPRWFLRLDTFVVNSGMATMMVAVSDDTRRFCIATEGMRPDRVITIPNGVDASIFSPMQRASDTTALRDELGVPENALIIICVARLHPQKGHSYLLEALETLRDARSDFVCLLVGDGPERGSIESHVSARGLQHCVRLLGNRPDVARLLAVSDIFVLPSLHEGLSNALLEAMAVGLPVVASDVSGMDEILVNGETGFLVPAADSNALASALTWLLDDEGLRTRMGRAARQHVLTRYSQDVMLKRYEQVLMSQLAAKGRLTTPSRAPYQRNAGSGT